MSAPLSPYDDGRFEKRVAWVGMAAAFGCAFLPERDLAIFLGLASLVYFQTGVVLAAIARARGDAATRTGSAEQ